MLENFPKSPKPPGGVIQISVVLTALNEEQVIGRYLESLARSEVRAQASLQEV
jgi:glycosyltransferase involved in cell wall biosynthesis